MLPNFLIIGAMKAGTTSLYHYLYEHPEVFMASPKELDFFVASRNWHRGVGWYEAHFEGAGAAVAVGEASPNYSKAHSDSGVADRIADVLPDAKLLYIVRDPIERIRSMYAHLVDEGVERRSIDDAVAGDDDYLQTSRYALQLRPFLERFPRDRVLVMSSETLRDNRREALSRIFRFVGVDPTYEPAVLNREFNRGKDRRVPRRLVGRVEPRGAYRTLLNRSWRARAAHRRIVTRRTRTPSTILSRGSLERLRDQLVPDVAELRGILGAELDHWHIEPG